jgi:hypothetical protein
LGDLLAHDEWARLKIRILVIGRLILLRYSAAFAKMGCGDTLRPTPLIN